MPDALHLLFGDLVGDDGKALIKLHCISIDYFAIKLTCYFYRELPVVMNI